MSWNEWRKYKEYLTFEEFLEDNKNRIEYFKNLRYWNSCMLDLLTRDFSYTEEDLDQIIIVFMFNAFLKFDKNKSSEGNSWIWWYIHLIVTNKVRNFIRNTMFVKKRNMLFVEDSLNYLDNYNDWNNLSDDISNKLLYESLFELNLNNNERRIINKYNETWVLSKKHTKILKWIRNYFKDI